MAARLKGSGCLLALATAMLAGTAGPAAARTGEQAVAKPPAHTAKPEGPLRIIVSIGSQRLRIYDKNGLYDSSTVSTGVDGYPTPTGVFAVLDKERVHYSNIYGGAAMPFMQRLTMSGVALHSGQVTGRPASHGCIRLPHAFAIRLFGLTDLGTRVIVAPDEPEPVAIAHARLFVMRPLAVPDLGIESALRAVASQSQPARYTPAAAVQELPLEAVETAAAATGVELDFGFARGRMGPATAEREAALRVLPITVFVSKAEGRVFVRQGFTPLFDAPIEIREPEQALGTHVYTAIAPGDGGGRMRWSVVSTPRGLAAAGPDRRRREASRFELQESPAPSGPASNAAEALERIGLPQEATDRIQNLLTVGATLIVSDHGLGREIRASGTDFVVLTR